MAEELPNEVLPSDVARYAGGSTEETLSGITHGIAAGLAVAGLAALLIRADQAPGVEKTVGLLVYGVSQVLLFLASSFTHGFAFRPRLRKKISVFDFSFIYVHIAGTYTPLCLIALSGNIRWISLAVMWSLAAAGIVLHMRGGRRLRVVSEVLYGAMSWFILVILGPVTSGTSREFVALALVGLAVYSVGTGFYFWNKLPYAHVVWHLFVIAGAAIVFAAYFNHLA